MDASGYVALAIVDFTIVIPPFYIRQGLNMPS